MFLVSCRGDEAYFISRGFILCAHLCLSTIKDLVSASGDIPHRQSANRDITLHSTINPPCVLLEIHPLQMLGTETRQRTAVTYKTIYKNPVC